MDAGKMIAPEGEGFFGHGGREAGEPRLLQAHLQAQIYATKADPPSVTTRGTPEAVCCAQPSAAALRIRIPGTSPLYSPQLLLALVIVILIVIVIDTSSAITITITSRSRSFGAILCASN